MTETVTLVLAAGSVVAAMLAVLLPVVLLQGRSLRHEINLKTDNLAAALAEVRTELAEVRTAARADLATAVADLRAELAEVRAAARADLASVRADLAAAVTDLRAELAEVRVRLDALAVRMDSVAERTARIEGALTGPWRPPANGNPAPDPTPAPAPAPSTKPAP